MDARDLLDRTVERFQVELQLAEVLGTEDVNLEFNRHQAVESAMKKQRSNAKSCPPTCSGYSEPTKQLIPDVAEAFVQECITASHANLIARLPQEHQAQAFVNCWRKDWQDKEAHLLPAKHLSA